MVPFLIICVFLIINQVSAQNLPSCDSKVFCQGNLLHTVQMARLFNDSKTFVDLKLVNDEATTLKNFETFINSTNNNPSHDEIKQFVGENFESYNEFDDWVPTDFTDNPAILSQIGDEEVKQFTKDLINIWPKLSKKIKPEVAENPGLFTLIPVENGFVIPGGRFKEFYYWDSYWIIKGLLITEMYDTARGMLENFLSFVEEYGFIPNGARIYYLNRSQPPLLSLMVAEYVKSTNDMEWLRNNIDTLDKELHFWLKNKLVTVIKGGKEHVLAHYDSESGSPRPESYAEDVATASSLPNEQDEIQLYADLKSGAESGWDFSSRWIIDQNGGNNANLTFLKTRRIIPVDLNSFLAKAFKIISTFYIRLLDFDKGLYWLELATNWTNTIDEVLYNREDGIWYDWDNKLQQHRKYFFPSNFAPLWTMTYGADGPEEQGRRAAEYFENQGIMEFQGGIPTSVSQTGEQWDYPNAWPPLQAIVILGLDRSGNCKAKKIAKEFANRWIQSNMLGFKNTDEMFEKYDAEVPGKYGGGGEYVIQSGFGWTNGVALELIERYYTTTKSIS